MSTYPTTQTFFVDAMKPDLLGYVMIGQINVSKDYTDADHVEFFLRDDSDETMKINGIAGSFEDKPNGILKYSWAADDLDTEGTYSGWFVVYWTADSSVPEPTSSVEILVEQPYNVMVT